MCKPILYHVFLDILQKYYDVLSMQPACFPFGCSELLKFLLSNVDFVRFLLFPVVVCADVPHQSIREEEKRKLYWKFTEFQESQNQ